MEKGEPTEKDLIERCIKDNRQAQEQLYRKYAPLMYTICLSYASDRQEAMDILQDGFIKVYRNLKKYDNLGSFEGWIKRIIINTAIDYYRKNRKSKLFVDINQEHVQIEDPVQTDVFSDLGYKEIIRCLEQLPAGARMVFNLYALEGFSHKEIATELDISEGTSKSQFSRAKTLLQEWLTNAKKHVNA